MAKKNRRKTNDAPVQVPTATHVTVTVSTPAGSVAESRKIVGYEKHRGGGPNYNQPIPEMAEDESLARFSSGMIMIMPKKKKSA